MSPFPPPHIAEKLIIVLFLLRIDVVSKSFSKNILGCYNGETDLTHEMRLFVESWALIMS